MPVSPRKVEERLIEGLRRFQPILNSAKTRDVNEADTVVIVTDLLAELFGYDKYAEITREYAVRSTFCDLAIKIDDKPRLLLEVKAIGLDLKDVHAKQAVDYAANLGVEWVILTNGVTWKVFRVVFARPIDQELVIEIDLLTLNARTPGHLDLLYPMTREGVLKAALTDYHTQRQAMSRFSLAALLLSEPMLKILRRELKKLTPGVGVETEDIKEVLAQEVLKREVVEGEKAEEARKKIQKAIRKQSRSSQARGESSEPADEVEEEAEMVSQPDGELKEESPAAAAVATESVAEENE